MNTASMFRNLCESTQILKYCELLHCPSTKLTMLLVRLKRESISQIPLPQNWFLKDFFKHIIMQSHPNWNLKMQTNNPKKCNIENVEHSNMPADMCIIAQELFQNCNHKTTNANTNLAKVTTYPYCDLTTKAEVT